jgi:hypothetical protein
MADAKPQQQSNDLKTTAQMVEPSALGPSWAYPPAKGATLKELASNLRDCLDDLQNFVVAPYRNSSSLDHWPSLNALNQMISLVEATGRAIGIKKFEFGDLDGVIHHIDRRYPKIGLLAFIDALVRKIQSIPPGPVNRIAQELAACSDATRTNQLVAVQDLLKCSDWELVVKPGTLRELETLLLELSGEPVKAAVAKAKPPTMQDLNFTECRRVFTDVIALAAFLELQRQHLLWRLKWDHKVLPVIRWVYGLQNKDWDTSLRRVLTLQDLAPHLFEKVTKRINEKHKKRRYRDKKRGPASRTV